MAIHDDLVEPVAIHPAAFVGTTDPSLDPDNNVLPYKMWVDTNGGPPYALKIRNAANTAWEDIAGTSTGSSNVTGPPGFAEEGEPGDSGIPGPAGTSSGSSLPPATATGQVLYSLDGTTFTARLPLTDPATGWLVDGGTGLLLVT